MWLFPVLAASLFLAVRLENWEEEGQGDRTQMSRFSTLLPRESDWGQTLRFFSEMRICVICESCDFLSFLWRQNMHNTKCIISTI